MGPIQAGVHLVLLMAPLCLPNPVGGGVSVRRGLCSPIPSKGGVDPSKGWNMVGTQHLAGEQMTPP